MECAVKNHHRRLYPMLLAAGARMTDPPPAIIYPQEEDDPYLEDVHAVDANDAPWKSNVAGFVDSDAFLCKVRAAGGFKAYEKAHRQALATKFVAKAFPCLPTDVTAQVASFAFHVGYY